MSSYKWCPLPTKQSRKRGWRKKKSGLCCELCLVIQIIYKTVRSEWWCLLPTFFPHQIWEGNSWICGFSLLWVTLSQLYILASNLFLSFSLPFYFTTLSLVNTQYSVLTLFCLFFFSLSFVNILLFAFYSFLSPSFPFWSLLLPICNVPPFIVLLIHFLL